MAGGSVVTRRSGAARLTAPEALLRAERALLWLLLGAMVVASAAVLVRPSAFRLPSWLDLDDGLRLLAGMAIYAVSHVLRFLRLAVLVHHPTIALRRVLQVHLMTTGLGVLLPFKLSELVRVRELGVVTGSWRTGLLAVWLERAFDAAVLCALLGIAAIGSPETLSLLTPFLALMTAFVALTLVLITVVPPNVRQLMLHLVRRPFGGHSLAALRGMRGTLGMVQQAVAMLRGRISTLLLLSVLIWIAELAVVSVVISGFEGVSRLSAAVLAVLSGVSAGASPLMSSSADRLVSTMSELGLDPDVNMYRGVLVLPALVAASVAGAMHLRRRP